MTLLEVGRIARAHGLRGEVVVQAITNVADRRFVAGARFVTDRGEMEMISARDAGDRWIVQFAGVADRTAAEALRGVILRAEPLADDDVWWAHELIGCEVRTPDGRSWGTVTSMVANPANELLELDSGALVPVVFLVSATDGVVVVDPPEGLLDDEDG